MITIIPFPPVMWNSVWKRARQVRHKIDKLTKLICLPQKTNLISSSGEQNSSRACRWCCIIQDGESQGGLKSCKTIFLSRARGQQHGKWSSVLVNVRWCTTEQKVLTVDWLPGEVSPGTDWGGKRSGHSKRPIKKNVDSLCSNSEEALCWVY